MAEDFFAAAVKRIEEQFNNSVAEVEIEMWNIVYTIPKGSRVRVDISSSDFPQYHVHSNQKGLWSEQTENKIAHQTIYMGSVYPSCVILPEKK